MRVTVKKGDIFDKLRLISYVGIFINLVLTIIKFYVGITGNSTALIADGFNSLSDIFAGIVVYISFKISRKPEDKEHPYGHAKAEMIATFIVALFIFLLGFSIVTGSSLKLYYHSFETPSIYTLVVAFITIITKEILYKWTFRWGKLLKSTGLIATAYDHRSDVFASLAVLIGIGFAIEGYQYMDPIAGIVVSIFIFRLGIRLIKESIGNLMDESPPPFVIDKIKKVINGIKGVEKITSIKIRKSGPYFYIDVEIEVNPFLTVKMSHDIAENVKYDLFESNPYINDVMIHINPYEIDENK